MAVTTLTQLLTEFYARGFDYLNDGGAGATRATNWINYSYLEMCEEEPWPFLEATASGAAPLTITDLGSIASVNDTANNNADLFPIDRRTLTDSYTLSTTGTASYYYIEGGSVVRTYPVGGTLSVRYWKIPAELSNGSDAVVSPARFSDVIVHGAVRRGHLDNDDYDAAQAVEQERQNRLQVMRRSLLDQDHDEPEYIVGASGTDW